MENINEIEQYLTDLDNLIETEHFSKESVREYTFYHQDLTLNEMILKGREYIRKLLISEKSVLDNLETSESGLNLHNVNGSASTDFKKLRKEFMQEVHKRGV